LVGKVCSYSCMYCQAGPTVEMRIERRKFYDPGLIARCVASTCKSMDASVVTFVPNGEPTLDSMLGRAIRAVKEACGKPVAVLTNGSLLWMEDVREDLMDADIVSVKIDTVSEKTWRRLNRPHPLLRLDRVLEGIVEFSRSYNGRLLTETMLVDGVNDSAEHARMVGSFLGDLSPYKAYLSLPLRPPADPRARPPPPGRILAYYKVIEDVLGSGRVEVLWELEPPSYRFKDDIIHEIFNMVRVHPVRLEGACRAAREKGVDCERLVESLRREGLMVVEHEGEKFIVPSARLLPGSWRGEGRSG